MEKLILERNEEDFYRIEVNDNGDVIEFDLTDISLAERIMNSSDEIIIKDKEYKQKVIELNEKLKGNEEQLTREIIALEKKQCLEMRKIFDNFLGDGACQKIFGDKNYYGMFLQLFEALEPHFEKMNFNLQKAKKRLASKYIQKENDVL